MPSSQSLLMSLQSHRMGTSVRPSPLMWGPHPHPPTPPCTRCPAIPSPQTASSPLLAQMTTAGDLLRFYGPTSIMNTFSTVKAAKHHEHLPAVSTTRQSIRNPYSKASVKMLPAWLLLVTPASVAALSAPTAVSRVFCMCSVIWQLVPHQWAPHRKTSALV